MNTARSALSSFGLSNAAIAASGYAPGVVTNVESYNGTSWSEITELGVSRASMAGGGTQTLGIFGGGYVGPPFVANTETWNGTAWAEVAEMATGRASEGCGLGTASLAIAGENPGYSALTEEWTVPQTITNVTVSSS